MRLAPTERGYNATFLWVPAFLPGQNVSYHPWDNSHILTYPRSSCRSTPRHWYYDGGLMQYQVQYGSLLSFSEVRFLSLST